ncbi:hypothetical protein ACH5RR_003258 [Cinchona calisaya]|uniref:Reverse transcriptase n=1 Tax=Cinchona calisaya TaxID=153742 RepID=A0ABD3AU99_9GENT
MQEKHVAIWKPKAVNKKVDKVVTGVQGDRVDLVDGGVKVTKRKGYKAWQGIVLESRHSEVVLVIKKTLKEFGKIAGLKPNLSKCQTFIAGLDGEEDIMRLCEIIQMPRDILPVKKFAKWFCFSKFDTVGSFIGHGVWMWPMGRRVTTEVKRLIQATPSTFFPHVAEEDQTSWEGSSTGFFTVKGPWKCIRSPGTTMKWYQLFWGKGHVLWFLSYGCYLIPRQVQTGSFKVFKVQCLQSANGTRKIVILQSVQRPKQIYDQLNVSQTAPVEAQERELEEFCPNKLQSERQYGTSRQWTGVLEF